MFEAEDTIAAVATSSAGAARGIVRLSGPGVVDLVLPLFFATGGVDISGITEPSNLAGKLQFSNLLDPPVTLPCELFIWPGCRSYTRQPAIELHTLGSPPLLELLVDALCRRGARLAEPGEFTLRAFLAGRIDLSQAEAVLGVIDADDDVQLNTALAQLAGGIARPMEQLRSDLLQLLAELEAGLDFVEEDIEFIATDEIARRLAQVQQRLHDLEQQIAGRAERGSKSQVVLVGPPNVGKSSLFNALLARFGSNSAHQGGAPLPAIVAPQRGTTRDYLTATLKLGNLSCQLVDTAGVKIASNVPTSEAEEITRAAQAHTAEQRQRATLRLICFDPNSPLPQSHPLPGRELLILTKADLSPLRQLQGAISVSSITGSGIDTLAEAIRNQLVDDVNSPAEVVAATTVRCGDSLRLAQAAIQRAHGLATSQGGDELIAAETRNALQELGKIVGAVYTDDILDRVFSSFCIGK
jgi:tRNA modification GTPase